MKGAICWKAEVKDLSTIGIRGWKENPNIVIILNWFANQQVTKRQISKVQVGTSEIARAEAKFNQWLGGVIDGDGYLGISKEGYTSLEITMGIADEQGLERIKDKLGGSIKLRSGSKSIRYRLHNRTGMLNLIKRINGNIHNTIRLTQLKAVCLLLKVDVLEPCNLDSHNAWFSGMFDADGSVTLKSTGQLTIGVTQKYKDNIREFKRVLGGELYLDKSQNHYTKWQVQSRSDALRILDYFKENPSFTLKKNRLFLIPQVINLLNSGHHLAPINSQKYKTWLLMIDKWTASRYDPNPPLITHVERAGEWGGGINRIQRFPVERVMGFLS